MADNINTILVDNTSISKIMCLSRSNYLSMSANIDPYYDLTLFLVNEGTDKVTDIYLGANRFTDIIVQDVPPNSTDTPGKFYLVPYKVDDLVKGYDVWYLYSDEKSPSTIYPVKILSTHNSNLIKSLVVDDINQVVEFSFDQVYTEGSESYVTTRTVNVPILNYESGSWKLPDNIINDISSQLSGENFRPTWQPITPR